MMRKITCFVITFFQILTISAVIINAQNQVALNSQDLEKYTYYFDIVDHRMVGDGAKFLADEMRKNQFVLLGEYHDSSRISEFTKALIPVFHNAGGRTFALEVGPVSAEMLAGLAKDPAQTVNNLNVFNSRYYTRFKNGRQLTPIPFFKYVEDADFLNEAAQRKWDLIGLDQEFGYGYLPLIERMYANLNSRRKRELKLLYEQAAGELKKFYDLDADDGQRIYVSIAESKVLNEFLAAAASNNAQNRRIADELRLTNAIYLDNINRKYYLANSRRVSNMKRNLREATARLKFNLRRDKLLLKMGAAHTGRGLSPLSLFEIGNTLSELAEYHGNTSLHIDFGARFSLTNGRESDALENKEDWSYRLQPLLQMGRKEQWTIIDLRPLREAVFYQNKYKVNDTVREMIKNHDLYIITKQERDPQLNIKLRKSDTPN